MCDDFESEDRAPKRQSSWAAPHPTNHNRDHEQRLLEYLDGRASAAERRVMPEHLADCASCNALAREWTELDGQLASQFKSVALSPAFSARVWSALEALPGPAAGEAPAGPARPVDGAAAWARARRRYLWTHLPAAFDQLGYAFALVLAVCLSVRVMPAVLNAWPHNLQSGWLALMTYGLGVSAPVSLLLFGWLAKGPLGRLLACL